MVCYGTPMAVCRCALWYSYDFKGGAGYQNRAGTMCDGVSRVPRVGLDAELAAMGVQIWLSRVGLAANNGGMVPGLAATIGGLSG